MMKQKLLMILFCLFSIWMMQQLTDDVTLDFI